MSEATFAAVCFVKALDFVEYALDHRGNDELSNAISALHHKGFCARVQQNNLYFAAIVGINGTG